MPGSVLPRRSPLYVGTDLGQLDPRVRQIVEAGDDTRLVVQYPQGTNAQPIVATPVVAGCPVYTRIGPTGRTIPVFADVNTGFSPSGEFFVQCGITLATSSETGLFFKIGLSDGVGFGVGSVDADTPGNNLLFLFEAVSWIPNSSAHAGSTVPVGTGFHTVSCLYSHANADKPHFWVDGSFINSYAGFTPQPATGSPACVGVGSYGFSRQLSSGVKLHYAVVGSEIAGTSAHDTQVALAASLFPPGRDPLIRSGTRKRRFFVGPVGGAAVTGTLAATEGADTCSMTGTETFTGTLSATEGADACAMSGVETFSGTLAATEGADSCSMSGVAGEGIGGTLAATEGADTAAATGTVTAPSVTGTLAATEGADSAAASGNVIAPVTGTLAATEGADSAAASGAVAGDVTGTLAATEGADTCYMQGIGGIAAPVGGAGPGGGARRRRRAFLLIDGQEFEVENEAHALALLEQAKAAAAEAAKARAAEIVAPLKPKTKPSRKPEAKPEAAPMLALPEVDIRGSAPWVDDMAREVEKWQRDLREMYAQELIEELRKRTRSLEDEVEALTVLLEDDDD